MVEMPRHKVVFVNVGFVNDGVIKNQTSGVGWVLADERFDRLPPRSERKLTLREQARKFVVTDGVLTEFTEADSRDLSKSHLQIIGVQIK